MTQTVSFLKICIFITSFFLLAACGGDSGGSSKSNNTTTTETTTTTIPTTTLAPNEPPLETVSVNFATGSDDVAFNQDGTLRGTPELNSTTPNIDFMIAPQSSGSASETTGDITIIIDCSAFELGASIEQNQNTYCNFGRVSMTLLGIVYKDTGTETSLSHPDDLPHELGRIRGDVYLADIETKNAYASNISAFDISGHQIKIDTAQLQTLIANKFGTTIQSPLFADGYYNMTLELPTNIPLDVHKFTGTFSVKAN